MAAAAARFDDEAGGGAVRAVGGTFEHAGEQPPDLLAGEFAVQQALGGGVGGGDAGTGEHDERVADGVEHRVDELQHGGALTQFAADFSCLRS